MNSPEFSLLLFGISGGEIFIILLLILVLFGPKKIPEIARALGKGINEVKKVQRDINAEINRYSQEIENPARQVKEDLEGFKRGMGQAMDTATPPAEETPGGEGVSRDEEDLPEPYNKKDNSEEDAATEPKENLNPGPGNKQE